MQFRIPLVKNIFIRKKHQSWLHLLKSLNFLNPKIFNYFLTQVPILKKPGRDWFLYDKDLRQVRATIFKSKFSDSDFSKYNRILEIKRQALPTNPLRVF